jgi:hypothetical protein
LYRRWHKSYSRSQDLFVKPRHEPNERIALRIFLSITIPVILFHSAISIHPAKFLEANKENQINSKG